MPAYGEKKMIKMIEQGDNFRKFDLKEAVLQYSTWASLNVNSNKLIKGAFTTLENKKTR